MPTTYKQCVTCSGWLARFLPEDMALTIYPLEMRACPRCGDEASREITTDAVPRYKNAPVAGPKTKTLF